MSFNRSDYREIFDFAEAVYKANPALRIQAEKVMAMVETVVGQQRAHQDRVNPETATAAYYAACMRK